MNNMISVKNSSILVNNQPKKLYFELESKNELVNFSLEDSRYHLSKPKVYFNKFIKSGSSLSVFIYKYGSKHELFLSFKRNVHGKMTIINETDNTNEVLKLKESILKYKTLFELIFSKKIIANYLEIDSNKKEKPASNIALIEEIPNKEDFNIFELNGPFYNSKEKILKVNSFVKENKPAISLLTQSHGLLDMERLTISFKKGTREQNTRLIFEKYNLSDWSNVFSKFLKNEINVLEFAYWQSNLRYRMNFFTMEYINNRIIFSYTLKNEDMNYITINFLEINKKDMIIIEPFNLEVLASFFNIKEDEIESYFKEKLKTIMFHEENKKINKKFEDMHQWAKEKGFVLDYLDSYDENKLRKTMNIVKNGYTELEKEVDMSKFHELYKIAFTKTNNLGYYYFNNSKLEFSIKYSYFDESTVYHEYGHLIYYSLLSKQIVGEEKSKLNNKLIKDFLSKYKNCSYIQVLKTKKSTRLSYYREDTELFARFFETYMMIKTNKKSYEEKMKKHDTMNSFEELDEFILFMNNHFDMNLSL